MREDNPQGTRGCGRSASLLVHLPIAISILFQLGITSDSEGLAEIVCSQQYSTDPDACANCCWTQNGCTYTPGQKDGNYYNCLYVFPTQKYLDCIQFCPPPTGIKGRGMKTPPRLNKPPVMKK